MIGEIVPELYDVSGLQILAPTSQKEKRLFEGTFPMGRYVTQPLGKQYSSIQEIRQFLRSCKYVSDREQFGKEDYWIPPEDFEKAKKGDCDDFALWTWRQFLGMGYTARYVIGRAGRYGDGHAWVTFEKDGRHFIVEPLLWSVEKLPRLSFIRYAPSGSVEWDGRCLKHFIHEKPNREPAFQIILKLVAEWMWFWLYFWGRVLAILCMMPYLLPRKLITRFLQRNCRHV
jgi:predicted transglutaminase-like cysteine proteinase